MFNFFLSKQIKKQKMSEEKRYSSIELNEFKLLINKKLEKANEDFKMYRSAVSNSDGNGTDDTSPTFKVLEEGEATLSKEEANKLAQRQEKFINHLKSALIRIEWKTYGFCTECKKLILRERLMLAPHASMCVGCKESKSKDEKKGFYHHYTRI